MVIMAMTPQPKPKSSPKLRNSICRHKMEDGTECGALLKPVHVSKKKWRTTKCAKGHVILVRGDNSDE